jgi:hypothetical protein
MGHSTCVVCASHSQTPQKVRWEFLWFLSFQSGKMTTNTMQARVAQLIHSGCVGLDIANPPMAPAHAAARTKTHSVASLMLTPPPHYPSPRR